MDLRQMIEPGMVVGLREASALDRSQVGSKAANLASLLQAGYPVPSGWVLTAEAQQIPANDDGLSSGLKPVLQAILVEAGEESLAVRSSAIAEDLADASFAGQYETVLGVRGLDQVETAVRVCWESLHSSRVASYRNGPQEEGMAVLIQFMVDAQASGVAFSAHPVTGARDEVVINAVTGIGDKLVSGDVTPAEWIVKDEKPQFVSGPEQVIDGSRVLRIAELVRRVETHFGVPQDIEWAIEDDVLHLLQARPITALPEGPIAPIPIEVEIPKGNWEHDGSHFPNASYPIDSVVPKLISAGVESWVNEFGYLFDGIEFRDIGGWTYQRLRPIGGKDGPDLPGWLMWLLVRTVPALRRRIAVARDAVRTDRAGRFVREWHDSWLPELSGTIATLQAVDLPALSDVELARHVDAVLDLSRRGIEVHTLVHGALAPIVYELVKTCEQLLGWDIGETLQMVSGTSFKSTEPARRLHELAEMAKGRPEVIDISGIPEGEVLAHLAHVDPEFAASITRYIHEYGHRALGDSTAEPTIAERTSFLLGMIQGQIATGYDPDAIGQANARVRVETIERARGELAGNPTALAEFERVLGRAQEAYPAREDNEFYTLSAPFALLRYVVLELGNRLASRAVTDQRDDVMFLHLDEARTALSESTDLRDLIRGRKGKRAWAVTNPGPPFHGKVSGAPTSLWFLPADARLPMESMLWSLESMMAIEASKTTQSDPFSIQGTPVSTGSYTGPVRIVRGEGEFDKLQAGDVLVCPITSPVWSVLFPAIGALVTDTGGVLSHPAIIAREYRIPAVVATGNATRLLEDGQIVTVNGSTGTVEVIRETR